MAKGINIRMSDEQLEQAHAIAIAQGKTVSDMVREMFAVEAQEVKPRIRQPHPNAALLAEYLRYIAAAGNNLNQLVKKQHEKDAIFGRDALLKLKAEIEIMRKIVVDELKR